MICVDSEKERGELYVKALNDSVRDTRAYFYQCDVRDAAQVEDVVRKVTKDVGDISVLINAAGYNSLVSTYFDVSERHVVSLESHSNVSYLFHRSTRMC